MFKKTMFFLALVLLIPAASYANEREGVVTFEIEVNAPENSRDVRLWVPYPQSDSEQTISDIKIDGNFTSSGVYTQKEAGDTAFYAEWKVPTKTKYLTMTFKAKAIERIKKSFPQNETAPPLEVKAFSEGSEFIPTDGKIKEIASGITKDADSILKKAELIYDWVIANTYRDPNVIGCGIGSVERILAEKGGKCADISGVYVALARAAGVPAREVWGLRLGKNPIEDITGGQHCWAEVYLPEYGWFPLDPADVRKAMLVEKLEMDNPKTKEYRNYYFGAVDEYRIVLSRGTKGYNLNPPQKGGTIAYGFMYPYAEIDGKPVDWLAGQKELKYKITFLSLSSS
ncbi:MAG: transglutaminase domain-containing protein [Deltaproteobacteria bacterium]|nr:transglutaminase domain-containing protein [Deltaproteobacteria bacterium]